MGILIDGALKGESTLDHLWGEEIGQQGGLQSEVANVVVGATPEIKEVGVGEGEAVVQSWDFGQVVRPTV